VFMCMYLFMFMCMYMLCLCVCVCACLCLCVCVCICIYVCHYTSYFKTDVLSLNSHWKAVAGVGEGWVISVVYVYVYDDGYVYVFSVYVVYVCVWLCYSSSYCKPKMMWFASHDSVLCVGRDNCICLCICLYLCLCL